MKLAHYVINKLRPHGMPKIEKFSPQFMLTQQTFDTCMFQFPFLVPIENLVDKWHNQYMDICGVRILLSKQCNLLFKSSFAQFQSIKMSDYV